eukprot:scaffold17938_cov61-Phaeocystis_antarctica.AAC.1
MGQWVTVLEQLAQRHRWPQGTAANSASSSRQMAHSAAVDSVEAGLSGSGSSATDGSSQSVPTLPLEAAVAAVNDFTSTRSSSQVRTELCMRLAARLRFLRRAFLRQRSHARTRRWRMRAAVGRASTRSTRRHIRSVRSRPGLALTGLRAILSPALSESRLARTCATTSGDAALSRLAKTLVSIALVASDRATCRSSTAFASAMAAASAAALASSFALFSVVLRSFRRRRLSLGKSLGRLLVEELGCGSTIALFAAAPPRKGSEDASRPAVLWNSPQNNATGIPTGWKERAGKLCWSLTWAPPNIASPLPCSVGQPRRDVRSLECVA